MIKKQRGPAGVTTRQALRKFSQDHSYIADAALQAPCARQHSDVATPWADGGRAFTCALIAQWTEAAESFIATGWFDAVAINNAGVQLGLSGAHFPDDELSLHYCYLCRAAEASLQLNTGRFLTVCRELGREPRTLFIKEQWRAMGELLFDDRRFELECTLAEAVIHYADMAREAMELLGRLATLGVQLRDAPALSARLSHSPPGASNLLHVPRRLIRKGGRRG